MEDTKLTQTMQNWDAGKTKNGKQIVVRPNGTGLFYIEMQGGGKKPDSLKGEFTGITAALEAVQRYLVTSSYVYKRNARNKAEEDSNAKNSNTINKRELQ